ncbi:Mss4p nuclear export [Epichloe festucae Fl1]|uniref:Protein BCP1 n=1 Tax=Epichloe festucae (strain Fl1) TaxID=877507 RepID=A0A7U3SN59_EPIFF|nr:Mss4p nuclear export [Epichloe festucae Fl1]
MGKKRSREDGKDAPAANADADWVDEDVDEEEDFDVLQVEFEWFNFDPKIDFHGVKSLMRQLFDVDHSFINTSALADLILSQPTIGSTVKVDGKEYDAYVVLTVLNTFVHREKEPMKQMLKYLTEKAQANESLAMIVDLLNSDKHIGLVLSERLINIPSEIAPPLYSMLIDEIEAAVEDKEPYEFSHYLILSKAYLEVESTLDVEKRKKKKPREEGTTFFFHLEDEIFHKFALAYGNFTYTNEDEAVSDSKRAFQEVGIKTAGHMILMEAGKLRAAQKAIAEHFKVPDRQSNLTRHDKH